MVKLIVGHKGTGKTKMLVGLANSAVETSNGSIVFINKDHSLMYDLKYQIRVICMEEFDDITNIDEYIGFLYGIISSDHDMETIFIDGILHYADVEIEHMKEFLTRLQGISARYKIDFVVSLSAEQADLGDSIDGCELIN